MSDPIDRRRSPQKTRLQTLNSGSIPKIYRSADSSNSGAISLPSSHRTDRHLSQMLQRLQCQMQLTAIIDRQFDRRFSFYFNVHYRSSDTFRQIPKPLP